MERLPPECVECILLDGDGRGVLVDEALIASVSRSWRAAVARVVAHSTTYAERRVRALFPALERPVREARGYERLCAFGARGTPEARAGAWRYTERVLARYVRLLRVYASFDRSSLLVRVSGAPTRVRASLGDVVRIAAEHPLVSRDARVHVFIGDVCITTVCTTDFRWRALGVSMTACRCRKPAHVVRASFYSADWTEGVIADIERAHDAPRGTEGH